MKRLEKFEFTCDAYDVRVRRFPDGSWEAMIVPEPGCAVIGHNAGQPVILGEAAEDREDFCTSLCYRMGVPNGADGKPADPLLGWLLAATASMTEIGEHVPTT